MNSQSSRKTSNACLLCRAKVCLTPIKHRLGRQSNLTSGLHKPYRHASIHSLHARTSQTSTLNLLHLRHHHRSADPAFTSTGARSLVFALVGKSKFPRIYLEQGIWQSRHASSRRHFSFVRRNQEQGRCDVQTTAALPALNDSPPSTTFGLDIKTTTAPTTPPSFGIALSLLLQPPPPLSLTKCCVQSKHTPRALPTLSQSNLLSFAHCRQNTSPVQFTNTSHLQA
jgi:hypothetical protein